MSETQIKYPNFNISEEIEQISKLSLNTARLKLEDEIEKYDRLIKERGKTCSSLYVIDSLKIGKDRLSCFYKYVLWLLYLWKADPKTKFETYLTGKYKKDFDLFCSDWRNKNIEKEIRTAIKQEAKKPRHKSIKEN